MTDEQMAKRERNRKSRQAKKDSRERDAAKYTQTRLDGTTGKGGGKGGKRKYDRVGKGGDGGADRREKGGKGRGKGNNKGPKANWNHEDKSVTVEGITYDTVDEQGQRVAHVLGLPEPVCYSWCAKAGACTQPNHANHQGGDEAVAHWNITDDHRELFREHFARG